MINNRGFSEAAAKKIKTSQSILYTPAAAGKWSYSHHAQITEFKGKLYAMWSSGRTHEDLYGQRVMMSKSENGVDWEVPTPLFDTMLGENVEGTLTAAGFHVFGDTLYAYAGYYERLIENAIPCYWSDYYEKIKDQVVLAPGNNKNTRLYSISTTDGENWSPLRDIGLPMVPNLSPQKTASGRLIIPGNFMFPYTDDPTGQNGWVKTGLFPKEDAPKIIDNMEYSGDFCEGSLMQTDDGVLHMLLRSGWIDPETNYLAVSTSYDNGETWSCPERTEFTDDYTKFFTGRLPDGRYFIVSNPVTHTRGIREGRRCPLVLSLSDNGEDFRDFYIIEDKKIPMQYAGLCKVGIYGYPHATIWNNKMYVIYSINKEQVAVTSFDLAQLR